MTKKKEKRGRKALPLDQKKPPQPTIKINEALFPFVSLLKIEYKAKRVSIEKMNALTKLLLSNEASPPVATMVDYKPDNDLQESTED